MNAREMLSRCKVLVRSRTLLAHSRKARGLGGPVLLTFVVCALVPGVCVAISGLVGATLAAIGAVGELEVTASATVPVPRAVLPSEFRGLRQVVGLRGLALAAAGVARELQISTLR